MFLDNRLIFCTVSRFSLITISGVMLLHSRPLMPQAANSCGSSLIEPKAAFGLSSRESLTPCFWRVMPIFASFGFSSRESQTPCFWRVVPIFVSFVSVSLESETAWATWSLELVAAQSFDDPVALHLVDVFLKFLPLVTVDLEVSDPSNTIELTRLDSES